MTVRGTGRAWLLGILLVAGLLVPTVVEDSYVRHLFIISFVYAIVAASWDLTLGYAGIFNFAHIAFFGIGAYATGLAAKLLGIDPWFAMLIGGFAASVAASIIALPVVRLQGVYVVLVTFAFSQLVFQLVISQSQLTGGTLGLVSVPTFRLADHNFLRDYKLGYYYVAFALLVATTASLRLLVRSNFGLSIKAVRDSEDYAVSRGIPVARQRLKALVASAFFAGLGGGFNVIYLRVASPQIFDFSTSSLVLSMLLVGGTSTIYGPIFAALLLTFLSEGLAGINDFAEGRFMLVAVAMVLVLLFSPKGLASVRMSRRLGPKTREPGTTASVPAGAERQTNGAEPPLALRLVGSQESQSELAMNQGAKVVTDLD